jgi:hypothetical protein
VGIYPTPRSNFDDGAIPVMEELLKSVDNPKKQDKNPKGK